MEVEYFNAYRHMGEVFVSVELRENGYCFQAGFDLNAINRLGLYTDGCTLPKRALEIISTFDTVKEIADYDYDGEFGYSSREQFIFLASGIIIEYDYMLSKAEGMNKASDLAEDIQDAIENVREYHDNTLDQDIHECFDNESYSDTLSELELL